VNSGVFINNIICQQNKKNKQVVVVAVEIKKYFSKNVITVGYIIIQ